jgi:hypothetical protein
MGAPRHCRKERLETKSNWRQTERVSMTMLRIMTVLALLVPAVFLAAGAHAQEIDFDQINKFESV